MRRTVVVLHDVRLSLERLDDLFGGEQVPAFGTALNVVADLRFSQTRGPFKNALLGDAEYNMTAMPHEAIVAPWKSGFLPESEGGCPEVTPSPCEGPQCGPP